jgi:hypothetical protein
MGNQMKKTWINPSMPEYKSEDVRVSVKQTIEPADQSTKPTVKMQK